MPSIGQSFEFSIFRVAQVDTVTLTSAKIRTSVIESILILIILGMHDCTRSTFPPNFFANHTTYLVEQPLYHTIIYQ